MMEKKPVCISLTAHEFEALSSFAKNQNELSNWVWTKIIEEARKAGLIKIKATSPKYPSKPKERHNYETPVNLLREFFPTDELVEEYYSWMFKQDMDHHGSMLNGDCSIQK